MCGGANLRALFDSYDTDRNGTIELSELSAVVQRIFPDLISASEVSMSFLHCWLLFMVNIFNIRFSLAENRVALLTPDSKAVCLPRCKWEWSH